jgi:4-azaleucine resistance transporter AzlC
MRAEEKYNTPSLLMDRNYQKSELILGIRTAIPIAIGYIPIAIAFGMLAKSSGIPNYITIMMSLFIFAGASQFVGVNLIALGTGFAEIIVTTFLLNLRHFLMSASILQRIEQHANKKLLALMSFGLTDETFSIASVQKKERLTVYFLLTLNLTAFTAWNIGTVIGIFAAEGLPELVKNSMGIALYAMFIGLLVPSMRVSLPVVVTSLSAAFVHALFAWTPVFSGLSTGWMIIIATIIGALVGSCLFPKGVRRND